MCTSDSASLRDLAAKVKQLRTNNKQLININITIKQHKLTQKVKQLREVSDMALDEEAVLRPAADFPERLVLGFGYDFINYDYNNKIEFQENLNITPLAILKHT